MEKVKIKRVKREKKATSAKEKVLAGLGVGSTLLGGAGAVMPRQQNTQLVRTQETGKSSNVAKVKQKLKDIFGIKSASASTVTAALPNAPQGQQSLGYNVNTQNGQTTVSVGGSSTSFGSTTDLLNQISDLNSRSGSLTPEEQQLQTALTNYYYASSYNNSPGVVAANSGSEDSGAPAAATSYAGAQYAYNSSGQPVAIVNHTGSDYVVTVSNAQNGISTQAFSSATEANNFLKTLGSVYQLGSGGVLSYTNNQQTPPPSVVTPPVTTPTAPAVNPLSSTPTEVLNITGLFDGETREYRQARVGANVYAVFGDRLYDIQGNDVTDSVVGAQEIIESINGAPVQFSLVHNQQTGSYDVFDQNHNPVSGANAAVALTWVQAPTNTAITVTGAVALNMSNWDGQQREWREGTVFGTRYAVLNNRLYDVNGNDVTDQTPGAQDIINAINSAQTNYTITDNRVVDSSGQDVTSTATGQQILNDFNNSSPTIAATGSGGLSTTGPGNVQTPPPAGQTGPTSDAGIRQLITSGNSTVLRNFLNGSSAGLPFENLSSETYWQLYNYMRANNLTTGFAQGTVGAFVLSQFRATGQNLTPGSGTQVWSTEGVSQAYNAAVRPFTINRITGPNGEVRFQVVVDMGSGQKATSDLLTAGQINGFLTEGWRVADNFMAMSQTQRSIFAAFVNAGLQYPEFLGYSNVPRPNTAITETIVYYDSNGQRITVTQPWDPSGLSTRAEAEFLARLFPGSRIIEESQPNARYTNSSYTVNYNGDPRRRYNIVLSNGSTIDVALALNQYRMYGADGILGINNIPGFSVDAAKAAGVTDATGPQPYVTQPLSVAMGNPANTLAAATNAAQASSSISSITIESEGNTLIKGRATNLKITGTNLTALNLSVRVAPDNNTSQTAAGFNVTAGNKTASEHVFQITPASSVTTGYYKVLVYSGTNLAASYRVNVIDVASTTTTTTNTSNTANTTNTNSTTTTTATTDTNTTTLPTNTNLGTNPNSTTSTAQVTINHIYVKNQQGQDMGNNLNAGYTIEIGGTNLSVYNNFQLYVGDVAYNFTNFTISDTQILLTVPGGLPNGATVRLKLISRLSGFTGFADKTFVYGSSSAATSTGTTTATTSTGTNTNANTTGGTITTTSGPTVATAQTADQILAYQQEIARLNAQINSLNSQLAAISSRLNNTSSSADLQAANNTIAQLSQTISQLQRQIQDLQSRTAGAQTPFVGLQMPPGYQAPAQVQGSETSLGTYTVKKGDTLWAISKKYYGDGRKWRKLLDANPECLSIRGNVRTLRIGAVLVIPQ